MSDTFKFLDDGLPILVLGIEHRTEEADKFVFKPGREWKHIQHQTCGHACHQHYLTATIIQPKPAIKAAMQTLNDKWLDSDAGVWGVSLAQAVEYNHDLLTLFGVEAQESYGSFEEAYYPIDAKHLATMTDEPFPKDLDDLIEWEGGFQRVCGILNRWKLVILGENCD